MPGSNSDGLPGSVTNWMLRGDDESARQLWERYVGRLLTLAQHKLDRVVRARVQEDDLVQSVFRSYFERWENYELASRDELWSLLVTITLHKAWNANRYHKRVRRDARRDQSALRTPGGDHGPLVEVSVVDLLSDGGPTPDEAVALAEEVEHRFRSLESAEDDDLVQVARMRLEGHTNREIAGALRLTERSIERKLNLIRKRWTEDWQRLPEVRQDTDRVTQADERS